uniref:M60 family metallopeptidase n=1 Tax=Alloprevotella sp. TaxID=1872471 RepID=UPI003FEF73E7
MIKSITQLLSRLLLLLCVGWGSVASLHAQFQVPELVSGTYYRIKTAATRSDAQTYPYLADDNNFVRCQALCETAGTEDAQLWLVTAVTGKDNFYLVQNKKTKKYLQPTNDESSQISMSDAATEVYIPRNTKTGSNKPWFNIMADANATYSYNWRDNDHYVRGYRPNDGKAEALTGSEWAFIRNEYTDSEIKDMVAAAGQVMPVAGTNVYRILNYSSKFANNALAECNNLLGSVTNTTDDSQYWQLVAQSDGKIALQNLKTGHYVQSLNGVKDHQFAMGTTAYGFDIRRNTNIVKIAFDIADTEDAGGNMLALNCTDKTNGAIYSWTCCDGSKDLNSLWVFYDAKLSESQIAAIKANRTTYEKNDHLAKILADGKLRIKSRRAIDSNLRPYVTDVTGLVGSDEKTCRMREKMSSEDADRQLWIAEKNGTGYTFRNYKTGKYLNYNNTGDAKVFYIRYNPDNTADQYYVHLSEKNDFSDNGLHYQVSGDLVMGYNVNAPDYQGCDWLLEPVDLTDAAVKQHFDSQANRLSNVATNEYIVIRDNFNTVMTEDYSDGRVATAERNAQKFNQCWKLVPVEGKEGYYQIQNAVTKHYINFAVYNTKTYATESPTNGGFKIAEVSNYTRFSTYFEMLINEELGHALHSANWCSSVLVWNSYAKGSTASVWTFEHANITEADLNAAIQDYHNLCEEYNEAGNYATALSQFFEDAACTTLKSAYKSVTDDALKTAMTESGINSTTLQNMAIKIKNNSWAEWEKIFRVRKVEPYTNPDTWNNILKIGYNYTRLSNPTGIWGNTHQMLYVFIGDDIPEGASVNLIQVKQSDQQGDSQQLHKGMNAILTNDERALYINYEVSTSDAADSKKWRDYPDLSIHIEGGVVDGYFDANREGINTNEAWKQMVAKGMFSKPFAMMKGRNIIYQMNSTLTKEYVPQKMREIVDFWDWMVDVQHSLMAVNEYKDRWHSVLGFYSCTYNFMFASGCGTYYNESTLKDILVYDTMAAGGGSLWGPAHEVGHIHQGLINMIGCTEISNNLFSQAVVHLNGKTSTRLNGRKFKNVADLYAANTSWHDYNLWDRNTMYLKLYLYYEVQGFHPGLFCELFRELRKDPLNHNKGSQNNPIPASEDFLKFALKVSSIVKEDLTEFFQAFGFFVPFETRVIGDYGDYYTYCTQEMIDEAKAQMAQYKKPKGNIMFVENHIKHEPAIDHDGNYLYNPDGSKVLRTDFSDTDAVGKCGDVGSYSDFATGHYASGYTYTIKNDSILTMQGEGAVGYKVYDNEGNLLYFSNCNTFALPQSVVNKLAESGKSMVLKVAQADGTDVTLPAADATKYTLKVYRADALTTDKCATVYTDGTKATLPTIKNNELVYIASTNATVPTTLTEQTNYVNAADNTAYKLVLTDKQDFYAPSAFTAQTVTYSRANTAGYNSVCLPFAISAADFGSEARLEQFTSTDGQSVSLTSTTDENAAGQPCFVYCPETQTEWTLTKQNAHIVAEPIEASDGNAVLHGSFTNAAIGAGQYKLTADGTAFGVTTNKGKVTAFRTYLTPATTAGAAALLQVLHDGAEVTGVSTAVQPAGVNQPAAVYDLTGRRVQRITRPGIYIVNGKKTVVRM